MKQGSNPYLRGTRLLLLLLAAILLFTSCQAISNEPIDTTGQTEESKAPEDTNTSPEDTTDTKQETEAEEETTQPQKIELEPPDPALLEQIEAQYNEENPHPVYFVDYFGTYNGCLALRKAPKIYNLPFEQVVADIILYNPNHRGVEIWKDGQFYGLEDAYNNQLLTKNDIQTIADITNNQWHLTLKEPKMVEPLEKEQLKQLAGTVPDFYYGIYNGYALCRGTGILQGSRTTEVGGVSFFFPRIEYLVFYKNGEKLYLQEAYDQGIITKEDLQQILFIHEYWWFVSYLEDGRKY